VFGIAVRQNKLPNRFFSNIRVTLWLDAPIETEVTILHFPGLFFHSNKFAFDAAAKSSLKISI
jgi:hypothetical protein